MDHFDIHDSTRFEKTRAERWAALGYNEFVPDGCTGYYH